MQAFIKKNVEKLKHKTQSTPTNDTTKTKSSTKSSLGGLLGKIGKPKATSTAEHDTLITKPGVADKNIGAPNAPKTGAALTPPSEPKHQHADSIAPPVAAP